MLKKSFMTRGNIDMQNSCELTKAALKYFQISYVHVYVYISNNVPLKLLHA